MSVKIEVDMKVYTCLCGTCYALPHWITGFRCPTCAGRQYRELGARYDKLDMEKCRLERVVRGLRGALKQRKVNR